MIDPIHSLAFSIQANRGVYAVLLGSGVSRSAKIPTGWEVTLDLVRKLAGISGEACDPSPEEWFRKKFGHDPDYSELLADVAKTPTERQQLLRSYWEPTEQEREEGAKLPTRAHRSIATLVAQGYVKVIITTNFDRLMETALADVGITPTVLSTLDQVHGTLPLIHTRCCLFKLHGDYLDTRILNTPEELSSYPSEFDTLLDRILDEFGLIICGWSADWDEALRRAFFRAPSRRFATYWAVRGEPSESAQHLIDHRGAQAIAISDADSFFQSVQHLVQSLEEFSRPHPLSTEAAVASMKRFLSEPRFRIQLADLVADEVARVVDATRVEKFPVTGPPPDSASATSRVRAFEAISSTLVAMAAVGGQWTEEQHYSIWQRSLEKLAMPETSSGTVYVGSVYILWAGLQKYPGTLLLYAMGIGAVESDKLNLLGKLFSTPIHQEHKEVVVAVEVFPPSCMFEDAKIAQMLDGMEGRYVPLNDWIFNYLRVPFKMLIPNEKRFKVIFDKFEVLMALGCAYHAKRPDDWYWAPPGVFGYRYETRAVIFKEMEDSLAKFGDQSPYVMSSIFGDTAEVCGKGIANLKEFIPKLCWR